MSTKSGDHLAKEALEAIAVQCQIKGTSKTLLAAIRKLAEPNRLALARMIVEGTDARVLHKQFLESALDA